MLNVPTEDKEEKLFDLSYAVLKKVHIRRIAVEILHVYARKRHEWNWTRAASSLNKNVCSIEVSGSLERNWKWTREREIGCERLNATAILNGFVS